MTKKKEQKRSPLSFASRCIHAGQSPDPSTGAVSMPIYATSTYAQGAPGEHKGFVYGRGQNPTRHAFERCIADLEDGKEGFAFASGMAAISAVLDLLPVNSHIVACDDLYGGSIRLFERVRKPSAGLTVSYVDMTDPSALEASFRDNTRLVWLETPTNPLMKIIDLEAIAAVTRKRRVLSTVDNTFATPWSQKPLRYGFDMAVHSATKYLGGHSDIIAGAVVVGENGELSDRMRFIQNSTGGVLGPFDSFLALRGLKTLDVRMERHSRNAMIIAEWLASHPKVEKVYYPGLSSHHGHDIAKRQMSGFGGMMSVRLKAGLDEIKTMLSSCRVFTLAESLGGVESLIQHPALMTHASVPQEQRKKLGIDDSLIRLSVGIESAQDLQEDLSSALS
ncbi:MAG TPA: PLP-dependent aspartate aminotransferase family protein [Thermodesulfobacteriota bacterium]|nr:PLP-dependent aspartate aminotransferase family protein [Thermodesulfobacteriota bacterium]